MQERPPTSRHKIYGGVAASVAVHAVIVAALLISLPVPETVQPPEESVSVEMVPPEEAPPEAPQEEEQALDLTMPEEKPEEQKAEVPPPPEPPQQEAEEQGAPPQPPAEPEAETAEQAAEPPPPPEQSEEQVQPEETPPEAQQQAQAEPPPPAAEEQTQPEQPPSEQAEQQQIPPQPDQSAAANEQQQAEGQPIPVLRPVFEFGEDEAGSEVAPDGDANEQAEDTEAPTDPTEDEAAAEATDQAAAEIETNEDASAAEATGDVAAPQIDGLTGEPLASSQEQPADGTQVDLLEEPTGPAPKSTTEGEEKPAAKPPKEVKRLFSQQDTDDPVAMTAMGSIPRDIRASQLCATELREQLRHASPAYQPELLPSYRLPEGTVLDIRQAAFRSNGQWFNIGFRCEIDQKATKVVSFGFQVGDAVPRSQWRSRGFPEL